MHHIYIHTPCTQFEQGAEPNGELKTQGTEAKNNVQFSVY